jgi:hypothetical protein
LENERTFQSTVPFLSVSKISSTVLLRESIASADKQNTTVRRQTFYLMASRWLTFVRFFLLLLRTYMYLHGHKIRTVK